MAGATPAPGQLPAGGKAQVCGGDGVDQVGVSGTWMSWVDLQRGGMGMDGRCGHSREADDDPRWREGGDRLRSGEVWAVGALFAVGVGLPAALWVLSLLLRQR